MRRHNGFAAIHDLLSRTRVVLRPQTEPRPGIERPTMVDEPSPQRGTTQKFGPFEVQDLLWRNGSDELFLAVDPVLRRRVWVFVHPVTGANGTRRALSRPARLRWLNSGPVDDRHWDAFEALEGQPLFALRGSPWKAVRFWLRDLAHELAEALEEP